MYRSQNSNPPRPDGPPRPPEAPRHRSAKPSRTSAFLGLAAAALLASCGGVGGGGAGVQCEFVQPSGAGFAGTAYYQDKLYDEKGFTAYSWEPVKYARVELRNGTTVMKTTTTDAAGNFCLVAAGVPAGANLKVRLKAVAEPPGVTSPDSGQQSTVTVTDALGGVYYLETDTVSPRLGDIVGVGALAVYEATDQNLTRMLHGAQGGAFNILDVALGGFAFVKGVWGRDLPNLQVDWRQDAGGGTYFASKTRFNTSVDAINIKGETLSDSDEYDDDIVLHEFGHFALSRLSDDNSPGGSHFINGATQDARLSWSEGWANFFSTLVRDRNPFGFSNRTGTQASLVDSFGKTIGTQRQVRFSYELLTPQAFLPDSVDSMGDPVAVSPSVFKDLTKHTTSEVSVAVALWDVYKGGSYTDGNGQLHVWQGIGTDGIRDVIESIPGLLNPNGWEPITFTEFWKAYSAMFPIQAADIRASFLGDRKMSMIDDEWGADDTLAELQGLVPPYSTRHEFTNLVPGNSRVQADPYYHTLFPEGDADLFRLQVVEAGTYRITTYNARDGVDTYLQLLQADGATPVTGLLAADGTPVLDANNNPAVVANDNYRPYTLTFRIPNNNGGTDVYTYSWLNYGGDCGIQRRIVGNAVQLQFSNCPPNAANPPPVGIGLWPEYLTSQVHVALQPGEYVIRVTRSPQAPPSAGKYGIYSLKVEGL